MSIRYILFDLDGTLLPLDQDLFIRSYMSALSTYMEQHGFEPSVFQETIWRSTGSMMHNDGSYLNEQVFWDIFTRVYGKNARKCEPILETFYHTHFPKIQNDCGYTPEAAHTVQTLKEMGLSLVLATQPVFPAIATQTRMSWAGLKPEDFIYYTTYENSSFCKPNPGYYLEILERIHADPSECLMVGNDAEEDLAAETVGMRVFLLTDCLLNRKGKELSGYPQGDWAALMDYIRSL